eukprot:TRINITY_DN1293_c0_g1_i2.p1 TRINITY_DN1293_c0_g1~~TRINITY_DN1293_c0_g1_i2.p1  ORF type:complete len:234 (+),score=50.86 TRINITY_DN1293_c0_g1_i2:101-802(+)
MCIRDRVSTQSTGISSGCLMPAVRHKSCRVKSVGAERKKAILANNARAQEALLLVTKYDVDKSGKLERCELSPLFEEMQGRKPTEEELDLVISRCDVRGGTGADSDGALDATEVHDALTFYSSYTQNNTFIEETFARFDKNSSGSISKRDLQALVEELNSGEEVTKEETEWILQSGQSDGDQVQLETVKAAMIEWYTVDVEPTPASPRSPGTPATPAQAEAAAVPASGCCSIC